MKREINDEIANGAAWDRMTEHMLELEIPLGRAIGSRSSWWKPDLPIESREQASRAWSMIHNQYRQAIHVAARELVRTGDMTAAIPAVLYFLSIRLDAAIWYLSMAITFVDDQPVSLTPFPLIGMSEYAEWLLTEWADVHASVIAYPEQIFGRITTGEVQIRELVE